MTEPTSMKGLPLVPLDPQWLMESPAFLSHNPQVVRATIKLIAYAWQARPAGTVPVSFRALAEITGLSEQEVGDHHGEIFDGWEQRDGRLCFLPLIALCGRVSARYGDVLEALQDQGAAVMQAPEEFELQPPEVVTSSRKGKHKLPKDWRPTPELLDWLRSHDFHVPEDVEFITEKFTSHYWANGEMRVRWDEAFRNFALRENRMNLPSRRMRPSPAFPAAGSRAARFGAAGFTSQAHNNSVLAGAAARANAQSETCHG